MFFAYLFNQNWGGTTGGSEVTLVGGANQTSTVVNIPGIQVGDLAFASNPYVMGTRRTDLEANGWTVWSDQYKACATVSYKWIDQNDVDNGLGVSTDFAVIAFRNVNPLWTPTAAGDFGPVNDGFGSPFTVPGGTTTVDGSMVVHFVAIYDNSPLATGWESFEAVYYAGSSAGTDSQVNLANQPMPIAGTDPDHVLQYGNNDSKAGFHFVLDPSYSGPPYDDVINSSSPMWYLPANDRILPVLDPYDTVINNSSPIWYVPADDHVTV